MSTMLKDKNLSLEQLLEKLNSGNFTYEEVCKELFKYNYDDYDNLFDLNSKAINSQTYTRIPIYKKECSAIIMLWNPNKKSAIHDHLNYDGMIKVLRGALTEISYKEKDNFIVYEEEGIANTGAIFKEDLGGIHAVYNGTNEIAVSLHIYNTRQTSLKGVRIFDIDNKKIGILNEKATSCSWNQPQEYFENIISL